MKVLKIILLLMLIPILYIGGNILLGTLTNYSPPDSESIVPLATGEKSLASDSLSLYIWNIGYAGLGEESDFFLDGGKMTKTSRELTEKNMNGVAKTVSSWKDADFILLQEVDERAARSYKENQFERLHTEIDASWTAALAYNFKVLFVPVPIFNPLGSVKAGLATFSPYRPASVERIQFPGSFPWPKKIYFLDRCFLVMKFPYKGKELLIINTHNSAYDDGTLKAEEMQFLKDYIVAEYQSGNYVIVGGDWNQCPPGYDCYAGSSSEEIGYEQSSIAADFMPEGWQWSYDGAVRTNRKLSTPYQKGETFTTIIDFYLVSPNVRINSVEGQELDFSYSDHQPVKLNVTLQ